MGGSFHRATVGVVLAVVMALVGAGAAQAAWSGSGALATGRYDHTATLLKDGRVLVTGGHDSAALASAQLYDPATNLWSNAGAMNLARHGHAAALLPSGKVLVAGGFTPNADPVSPGSYTRTAEVYDPAANRWTPAANMSTGRFQPTMTVLKDGRVLVAGGSGDVESAGGVSGAVALKSAEIYDPANNSWTDVPEMSAARSQATATLLDSGKVLVAGGYDNATGELTSAELFDPSNDDWSATGSLADARDSATATALANGDVLVAGGDGGAGSALASAEIYDAGPGTWHAAASMAGARQTAAAALLKDGTVLVAGGLNARLGTLLDTTERYDPDANAWTTGGTMGLARAQHTLTALNDGRALVVGGNLGGFAGGLTAVERFSAVTTNLTGGSFGSRSLGSASDVATSVLTNTGTVPLDVSGVSITGADAKDFEMASESCHAAPIAPGDTCNIDVRFSPTAGGARSATLTVADNTAAGTTIATLTGTGIDPAAAADGTPAAGSGSPGTNAGAGAPAATTAPAQATGPAKGGSAHRAVARASCTVKTTSAHGAKRSAVTCRMTWPTKQAVALRARLMRGKTVLGSARATARGGHATLTVRPARTLRPGRYTVVIARSAGTVVSRSAVRVS
jgi:N-acetylneuraminic acid mutarotase